MRGLIEVGSFDGLRRGGEKDDGARLGNGWCECGRGSVGKADSNFMSEAAMMDDVVMRLGGNSRRGDVPFVLVTSCS